MTESPAPLSEDEIADKALFEFRRGVIALRLELPEAVHDAFSALAATYIDSNLATISSLRKEKDEILEDAIGWAKSGPEASARRDVLMERFRQITVEDYTDSHDDMATRHQLALAAMGYVQAAACPQRDIASSFPPPSYWPWDEKYWKPKDPKRNLVMAGALIIAEIARLNRKEARASLNQQQGDEG